MNWKLWLLFILISLLFISAPEINAQISENINLINQYHHNWRDGVYDVKIRGDYAYLACGHEGLHIVNISNQQFPIDLARITCGFARAVTLSGDYAYVGSEDSGLNIIDISNPESPQLVNHIFLGGYEYSIQVVGNYVFVCTSPGGLTIFNVENPLEAQITWQTDGLYEAKEIAIKGNIAYLACAFDGIRVMDISNISSPQVLGTYSYSTDGNWANGVSISGDYAYIAYGWNGLKVVDLTTMQLVTEIGSLAYAYGTKVVGDRLYVNYGDPECPLAIVDISNPLSPQILGIYDPPEDISNFIVENNIAYIADNAHGFRAVDVSDPQNPFETFIYNRSGSDLDVTIVNNIAYVREELKLKVIDITNTQYPRELSYFETDREYSDLEIINNVAFLLNDGETCLTAVDVSNPHSLHLLGTLTIPSGDVNYRMVAYGHYLYIVENNGLRIVDVSDPGNMQQVGFFDQDHYNAQLGIFDHYIVIQHCNSMVLTFLDLTDPTSPSIIGTHNFDNYMMDLKESEGIICLATVNKLYLFDTEEFFSWNPHAVVSMPDSTYLRKINFHHNYLYVTGNHIGLRVYDLSTPTAPRLAGYYLTPGLIGGHAVFESVAVVADGDNLGFYDCSPALLSASPTGTELPQSYALLQNYPNPFNSSTMIQFEVPKSSHISLMIYDVLGRKVTTLANQDFTAGKHSLQWNGTDMNGQAVASGKYFVQMKAENTIRNMQIVLLK